MGDLGQGHAQEISLGCDQIADLARVLMDGEEFIDIADQHPIGLFDLRQVLGGLKLLGADIGATWHIVAQMGDPARLIKRIKQSRRMIGAIIADDHDIVKAQAPIPADPFDQKRPFIADRADDTKAQGRGFGVRSLDARAWLRQGRGKGERHETLYWSWQSGREICGEPP